MRTHTTHPEGPERHLNAARQKLSRDNFCHSMTKKGRAWAIAVRRGLCKSLLLLNSDHFSLEKKGNSVSDLAQVLSPLMSLINGFAINYPLRGTAETGQKPSPVGERQISFLGVIAFLQHAPKTLSASK